MTTAEKLLLTHYHFSKLIILMAFGRLLQCKHVNVCEIIIGIFYYFLLLYWLNKYLINWETISK